MSLKITSSLVEIQNSAGQVKFTSNNKLVYLRHLREDTINYNGSFTSVPFVTMSTNDFLIMSIKIISSSGNVQGNTGLAGIEVPANGSILTYVYGRASGNTGICDLEYLGINVCGSNLHINSLRFNSDETFAVGSISSTIKYRARLYSYF
jgi:hypothetical protein